MAEFINTIDVLGDEVVFNSLIDRSITEFKDDVMTEVKGNAFSRCVNLEVIELPSVTTIAGGAFDNCTSLVTLNFPNFESSGGYGAFSNCTSLETVYFPKLKGSSMRLFQNCSSLKNVYLPLYSSGHNELFSGCKSLETLRLPSFTSIGSNVFWNSGLKTLILDNTKLCTLSNVNAFNGTPFASGGTGGTVYVPSALIESYKTATNWSTLYNAGSLTFAAIEGSEYE